MMQVGDSRPIERIVRPRPVDIRELWPREDRNFTPWLAENIDILNEALGIELHVEKVEQAIPETQRSLDILASSKDRLVAIENQYGQVDHDHLTRGLAYAVKLNASALVVVAERHLDEFRAIARYLNDCADALADKGIRVYLVEVTVDGVGDYYVPRFTVVEQPIPWLGSSDRPETPTPLVSVEEFLGRVTDDARRATFAEAIDTWEREFGSVGFSAHALALYLRNPAKGPNATTAVFTLYDYGHCTVNRGYLLDSGAFPTEAEQATLNSALDEYLPGNERNRVPYFTAVPNVTAAGIEQFGSWLRAWLSERPGDEPST